MKKNIGQVPLICPMPMSIVGAMVNGKPNFLAVAWVSPVNYKPAMIAVALGKSHYTNQGIKESKAFSICIPNKALIEQTDYCGIVSGKNKDKSDLFKVYYEGNDNIPLIEECPVCIQLELEQVVDLPADELFIGKVIATFVNGECFTEDKPDITKINPFTLGDKQYWGVGKTLAKAWNVGTKLKK